MGNKGAKSVNNGTKSDDIGAKLHNKGAKITEKRIKMTKKGAKITEIGAISVINAQNRQILGFLRKGGNLCCFRWSLSDTCQVRDLI
ncbi:hypothetical protein ACFLSV_00290 [Bacteroidota bacterium]